MKESYGMSDMGIPNLITLEWKCASLDAELSFRPDHIDSDVDHRV